MHHVVGLKSFAARMVSVLTRAPCVMNMMTAAMPVMRSDAVSAPITIHSLSMSNLTVEYIYFLVYCCINVGIC